MWLEWYVYLLIAFESSINVKRVFSFLLRSVINKEFSATIKFIMQPRAAVIFILFISIFNCILIETLPLLWWISMVWWSHERAIFFDLDFNWRTSHIWGHFENTKHMQSITNFRPHSLWAQYKRTFRSSWILPP